MNGPTARATAAEGIEIATVAAERCNGPPGEPPDIKQSTGWHPGTEGRFVVRCKKSSGAMVLYGRYTNRSEAERHCQLLRWAGAVAIIEEITS